MRKYYILVRENGYLHLNYLFETEKLAMKGQDTARLHGSSVQIVEVKLPVK